MTRMLRLSLPIIVITALLQRAAAVETPTLETIEKTARQLASPLSTERITGEEWLESNASGAFAELARLIKHGDIKQQTRAARSRGPRISNTPILSAPPHSPQSPEHSSNGKLAKVTTTRMTNGQNFLAGKRPSRYAYCAAASPRSPRWMPQTSLPS